MAQADLPDYYASLGLPQDATTDQIKRRFRELARKFHPDILHTKDAEERFKAINLAHQVLSDPAKRASYDLEIRLNHRRNIPPPPSSRQRDVYGGRQSSPSKPTPANRVNAEASLERARNAFRRMSFRESETYCRQCLRVNRRNPEAYELLGDIRKTTGRVEEAIAMYSYGLQFDPNRESLRRKFDKLTRIPNPDGRSSTVKESVKVNKQIKVFGWLDGVPYVSWIFIGLGVLTQLILLFAVNREPSPMAPSLLFFHWNSLLCFSLGLGGFSVGIMAETLGLLNGNGSQREHERPNSAWISPIAGIAILSSPALIILLLVLRFITPRQADWFIKGMLLCVIPTLLFAIAANGGMPWVLVSGENIAFPMCLAGIRISSKLAQRG